MKTFEEAWAEKVAEGYDYGPEALEQVRIGWEMARGARESTSEAHVEWARKFCAKMDDLAAERGEHGISSFLYPELMERLSMTVVWADDASPFTGEEALALLKENERLHEEIEDLRYANKIQVNNFNEVNEGVWAASREATTLVKEVVIKTRARREALEKVAEAAREWIADIAMWEPELTTPLHAPLAELDALKGGG